MFPSDKAAVLESQKGNEMWEAEEGDEKMEKKRKKKSQKSKKNQKEKESSQKSRKKKKKRNGSDDEDSSESDAKESDSDSSDPSEDGIKEVQDQSFRASSQTRSGRRSGPPEATKSSTPKKRPANSPLPGTPGTQDASGTSVGGPSKRPKPRPKAKAASSTNQMETNSQTQEDQVIDMTASSSQGSLISGPHFNSMTAGTQRSYLPTPATQETIPLPSQSFSQDSFSLSQSQIPKDSEMNGVEDTNPDASGITIPDSSVEIVMRSTQGEKKERSPKLGKRGRESPETDASFSKGISREPFKLVEGLDGMKEGGAGSVTSRSGREKNGVHQVDSESSEEGSEEEMQAPVFKKAEKGRKKDKTPSQEKKSSSSSKSTEKSKSKSKKDSSSSTNGGHQTNLFKYYSKSGSSESKEKKAEMESETESETESESDTAGRSSNRRSVEVLIPPKPSGVVKSSSSPSSSSSYSHHSSPVERSSGGQHPSSSTTKKLEGLRVSSSPTSSGDRPT